MIDISKKRILEAAMQKQRSLVDDFERRIKDALANDGNVNEESYDSQTQTTNAGVASEVEALTRELDFAKAELRDLEKINPERHCSQVLLGAVVRTDHQNFFVSSSLEAFNVNDQHFFGISLHSPIYQIMKGRQPGDIFKFHNTVYRIESIY